MRKKKDWGRVVELYTIPIASSDYAIMIIQLVSLGSTCVSIPTFY